MLTKAQLQERGGYLGGSDAASALGLSRWGSPLSVWAEKTGQLPPREIDSEAAELGTELEDYVSRRFSRKTGKTVHRVNETIFHPTYPFLAANIDRRVVGEKAILEAKTTSAWKAKEWGGEDIPTEYVIQVMHYLAVTGAERAYVAVLIGNQDFKWKVIERDDRSLTDLVEREVYFWREFVEKKVMPVVGKRDEDTLSGLFPQAEIGKTVELTDEAANICELLESMGEDARGLEAQIDEQKNRLRAMIGDAALGLAGDWEIKWSNVPECEYTVKKKAHRKLSFKKKEKDNV